MPWSGLKIGIAVISVLLLFVALSFTQEMSRRWQYDKEVGRLRDEAGTLEKKVVELEHLNQYFRTDEYQERLAREKLNFSAPGEKVVLVPEGQHEASVATGAAAPPQEAPASNPLRWWHALFVAP